VVFHSSKSSSVIRLVSGKLAFTKSSLEKRHEHSSHRFYRQCATSFFSILAIPSLHFPTGEKKDEERKEEKSEGKEVKTKKARGCACCRLFVAAIAAV